MVKEQNKLLQRYAADALLQTYLDMQLVHAYEIRMYFYSNAGKTKTDWIIANWAKLFNPKIKAYPKLICSHEEIRFMAHDLAFTSTMRKDMNGADGVVLRSAQGVIDKHPENWYYYKLDCTPSEYIAILTWACYEVIGNAGYDKLAILSFGFPIRFHSKLRWICSEIGHGTLVKGIEWGQEIYTELGSESYWSKNRVPTPIRESLRLFLPGGLIPYSALTNEPLYIKGE